MREEVPSGRDLRASSFAGARNLDLKGADLSYCSQLGALEGCDLEQAKLDGARVSHSLGGTFVQTSFAGARLVNTYAAGGGSKFDRCNFTGANLENIHWSGSDLRGSVFVDANLEGADVQRCDLRGCDLRRARLDSALFRQVTLDETTDLRGASLIELVHDELRDNAGQLVLRGTDSRKARSDETTKTGAAVGLQEARLLEVVAKAAKESARSVGEAACRAGDARSAARSCRTRPSTLASRDRSCQSGPVQRIAALVAFLEYSNPENRFTVLRMRKRASLIAGV